jgi:hypothetical protein
VTDGERLVWATSYAIVFDRSGDASDASRAAALAVVQLREAAQQKLPPKGERTVAQIDERDFLDEIVSVP